MWCMAGKPSAEFVYHMEDVLEVYHRPYDLKRPVVCVDEPFKQLVGETVRGARVVAKVKLRGWM